MVTSVGAKRGVALIVALIVDTVAVLTISSDINSGLTYEAARLLAATGGQGETLLGLLPYSIAFAPVALGIVLLLYWWTGHRVVGGTWGRFLIGLTSVPATLSDSRTRNIRRLLWVILCLQAAIILLSAWRAVLANVNAPTDYYNTWEKPSVPQS